MDPWDPEAESAWDAIRENPGLPNSVFYRLECTDIFTHSRRLRLRYRFRSIPIQQQVYDLDIPVPVQYLHPRGPENFVANTFSRFVPFLGGEEELHLLDEFDITVYHPQKDKYKILEGTTTTVAGTVRL